MSLEECQNIVANDYEYNDFEHMTQVLDSLHPNILTAKYRSEATYYKQFKEKAAGLEQERDRLKNEIQALYAALNKMANGEYDINAKALQPTENYKTE